mmetsp:Transcript_8024/g.21369  ORF Transcript_8024/g.21369 Transcript_8024/m.21369 type:complete len:272 (-) Transcript_8024:593-1408(-)
MLSPRVGTNMSIRLRPTSSSIVPVICASICSLKFTGCRKSSGPAASNTSRTASTSRTVTSWPSRNLFNSWIALSVGDSMSMKVSSHSRLMSRAARASTRLSLSLMFVSCTFSFCSSSHTVVQCRSLFSACSTASLCCARMSAVTSTCATTNKSWRVSGHSVCDTCTWCHTSPTLMPSHLRSSLLLILSTLHHMSLDRVAARISCRASGSAANNSSSRLKLQGLPAARCFKPCTPRAAMEAAFWYMMSPWLFRTLTMAGVNVRPKCSWMSEA